MTTKFMEFNDWRNSCKAHRLDSAIGQTDEVKALIGRVEQKVDAVDSILTYGTPERPRSQVIILELHCGDFAVRYGDGVNAKFLEGTQEALEYFAYADGYIMNEWLDAGGFVESDRAEVFGLMRGMEGQIAKLSAPLSKVLILGDMKGSFDAPTDALETLRVIALGDDEAVA